MDSLPKYLHDQRNYTYVQTAALAWLAYDISLTFEDEVSFVWRRKWALPKLLFLIARYFGLANLISHVAVTTYTGNLPNGFCTKWLDFYSSGPIIVAFAVDALLVIRIYALYGRSKWMLAFLLCLLFGQPIIVIATTIKALDSVILFSKPSFLPFPGCLGTEPSDMEPTLAGWIFTLASQGIFFALTLLKYIQSIRVGSRLNGTRQSLYALAKESRNVSPLISLFLRDGTANFAVIFSSMVINMVFTILTHGPDKQLGIPWIIATNAVMGSRLYLNLKGFMTGLAMPSLSAMEYQVELPSGASMTMVSRNQLHMHWNYQRASYASTWSGEETLASPLSCRGKDDTFMRVHEIITAGDGDKLDGPLSDSARIPSLINEPAEFEGFVPEEISLSELESASRAVRGSRFLGEDGSEAQTASRASLLVPNRTRTLTELPISTAVRSLNSTHNKRPSFSSASSDLNIHRSGSSA